MIKKIKEIYRILFPLNLTEHQKFDAVLLENKSVSTVKKVKDRYKLEINHNFSVLVRDQNHSDFKIFQQIFSNGEYESVMHLLKQNKEKLVWIKYYLHSLVNNFFRIKTHQLTK